MSLAAPEPLTALHEANAFDSGVEKASIAGSRQGRARQSKIRGMMVHALSSEAAAFYEKLGFKPSPLDSRLWRVTLDDLKASARGWFVDRSKPK